MSKVKCCELGRLADIDISGVDKKIKEKEQLVRLCNFVDVYYNWAISKETAKNFMEASANPNEVARFSIKKGQVALTKDSETREDIGTAAYIADNFERTLLGYHCALITPYDNLLKGNYLNAFLHTSFAQKHFANKAGGSGQRYTLTVEALSSLKVPLPSLEKQELIGDFFSYIDRKIENNKRINAELETMVKVIFDYWFLQFDFPNEEGKPYKSSGGKMIWNEELKREIPDSWRVEALRNYVDVIRGVSYDKMDISLEERQGYVPLLKANNIQNGVISYDNLIYVKQDKVSDEQMLTKNSILITMSSGSKQHMGKTAVIYDTIPYTCGAFCAKIKCLSEYRCFFASYFRHSLFKNNITQMSIGTNINNINNEHIYKMKIPVPPQKILKQYENIVSIILDKQGHISKENQELVHLRDFLLPLLMNGQVGVGKSK